MGGIGESEKRGKRKYECFLNGVWPLTRLFPFNSEHRGKMRAVGPNSA
jgi:hypothetical protein